MEENHQTGIDIVELDVIKNSSINGSQSPAQDKNSRFSKRQWTVFLLFVLLNFIAGITFSIIGPFYPKEADKKGIQPSVYGFVFGIFELVNFIACPIYGKFLGHLGTKFTLNAGNFVMSICCMLFGLLDKASPKPFIILSFAVRIVEALGTSAYCTASYAIIAYEFPDNVGTIFSTLGTGFGFGIIAGPLLGGVLYKLGGYILPFLVIGSIIFLASCITFFVLPTQGSYTVREQSFMKLLAIPGVLICCFSVFSVAFSLSFIAGTLEPHLRQFSLSPIALGAVFVIHGFIYALTAPIWGRLADKYVHPKILCGIGGISLAIGFLLIGPVPFIPVHQSLAISIVGLCFIGIGIGAEFVSAFLDATREALSHGFQDDVQTYGFIAGLWLSATALGSFVGPSLGGILFDNIGFPNATLVVFGMHVLVAILSFGYYCLKSRKRPINTNETNHLLQ